MKTTRYSHLAALCGSSILAAVALSLSSCDVKQTQEAKAPTVEISPGQMPKYDVDAAKVTVQPEQKEVTVPKVTTEQKTITVPDVDVTMPDEQASPAASPAGSPATAPTP